MNKFVDDLVWVWHPMLPSHITKFDLVKYDVYAGPVSFFNLLSDIFGRRQIKKINWSRMQYDLMEEEFILERCASCVVIYCAVGMGPQDSSEGKEGHNGLKNFSDIALAGQRISNSPKRMRKYNPKSSIIPGVGQGIRSWLACNEFEPSTTKDSPSRGVIHVKSVLSLVWCGS
ncbi:hypothetical protein TNCV_1870621 [Trichonephila clavipes]|nr:hypothetical protein TNCV_1870621 [Trichonephila clavipes]